MQGLCWPARSTDSPRGWHANNNPRLKIFSTTRGALQLQPCLCSFYHNAFAPQDKASPTCNRPLCTEERPGSIISVHMNGQEHGDCRSLSGSVTERAWRTEQRDRGAGHPVRMFAGRWCQKKEQTWQGGPVHLSPKYWALAIIQRLKWQMAIAKLLLRQCKHGCSPSRHQYQTKVNVCTYLKIKKPAVFLKNFIFW